MNLQHNQVLPVVDPSIHDFHKSNLGSYPISIYFFQRGLSHIPTFIYQYTTRFLRIYTRYQSRFRDPVPSGLFVLRFRSWPSSLLLGFVWIAVNDISFISPFYEESFLSTFCPMPRKVGIAGWQGVEPHFSIILLLNIQPRFEKKFRSSFFTL